MESKAYRVSPLVVLFAIAISVIFAACAPTPAFPNPPKQSTRCIVLIGATWCVPCNAIETNVIPSLKKSGLEIHNFSERKPAAIHLVHIDKEPDPRPGWRISEEQIPLAVVFEGPDIVETHLGPFTEARLRELLDGKPREEAPPGPISNPGTLATPGDAVPDIKPVADSSKTPWDQLTELLGCDEAKLTLEIPNGRKIVLNEANAAATLPEHLTARIKMVGESIEITFDQPLPQAEGRRFGIRLGTSIPSINVTRDQATVRTGLGIPLKWKLVEHPFGSESGERGVSAP